MTEIRGQMTQLHPQSAGPTNRAEDPDLPSVFYHLYSVICILSSVFCRLLYSVICRLSSVFCHLKPDT